MGKKKTIGIIGGMGPLATADLYRKIVLHTDAAADQAHPRVCIDSNTAIPDRTAALLYGGPDPVPEMVRSAKRLARIGADFLIMPCVTAHNFYDRLQAKIDRPVLHMIAATRDAMLARGIRCAGLLATDGTRQSGLCQRVFEGSGMELLLPEEAEQQAVMGMIYRGIKAGDLSYPPDDFRRAMDALLGRGAETLILGCTELPLAFERYGFDRPATDPTLELALAAIRNAGCIVK